MHLFYPIFTKKSRPDSSAESTKINLKIWDIVDTMYLRKALANSSSLWYNLSIIMIKEDSREN